MLNDLPQGWSQPRFGELYKRVKRTQGDQDLPVLSVTVDGIVLQADHFNKKVASADTSDYLRVRRGEVAMSGLNLWKGGIDTQRIVPEGVVSPAYKVYSLRADAADADFMAHYLRSPPLFDIYKEVSQQGASIVRRNVDFDALHASRLPLPPLPEQKKIAAILASVDQTIEATEAVIEQTRRVKDGLLQDLLTRGIGHTRFKQTEIGEIPESWETPLLDAVAERGSGHTPSKQFPEYWDGGIKWVSLADSHALDQVYLSETDKEISSKGIANSSAVLHPAGTVFVSRDASVGRSAIAGCDLAVSQHFIAWRCGARLSNLFLYYFLQGHKSQFEQIAVGSTIKTIGLGYFKRLRIPLPSRSEQDAIAERLLSHDECIAVEQRHLDQLRLLKSGLLQDLLTGAVRVAA